jgi:hyperosmotically inducible periplasmic protein
MYRCARSTLSFGYEVAFTKSGQETGDRKMNAFVKSTALVALAATGTLVGCSSGPTRSHDVSGSVRKSLDQAGLKYVTVSQDYTKGVVTLGGHVETEGDKAQAEFLTKPIAAGQVVAVEIAVVPVGAEKEARAINFDIDTGIEMNLDAVLIQRKLHDFVKYDVKNAVVTLTGEVESQAMRVMAEKAAAGVPNVKQVINTVQIKNQKATSTM